MIGVGDAHYSAMAEEALMQGNAKRTSFVRAHARQIAATAAVLVVGLTLFASGSVYAPSVLMGAMPTGGGSMWHGVSLGGWLVMEINPQKRGPDSPMDLRPSWMYDQIFANSELDFVTDLRSEGGDAYAIQTMKNHWTGYIADDMLDAAKALGVDTMRLPVGYWIMDAPVGGKSPLEYGISPEGFVTGGLNHLYTMLVKMKQRGIVALVDIHAMPCNSACVSDGLYCAMPLSFAPAEQAPIADMKRCGGGVYPTTRTPSEGASSWGDVGVNAVSDLAVWIAALPEEASSVAAFQLANEPVLGAGDIYDGAVNAFYKRALSAARAHLPTMPLVLSFMGPSPNVLSFLKNAGDTSTGPVLADHHYYLNWQSPVGVTMPWAELHRRACIAEAEGAAHVLDVYGFENLQVIVGEWSLAANHDALLDLNDPEIVKELAQLYREQIYAFSKHSAVSGAFFWTLRMGSGWDPRPTKEYPKGRQVGGSTAWKSLPGYPFPVWSLLEMAEAGVASPLNEVTEGTCKGVQKTPI